MRAHDNSAQGHESRAAPGTTRRLFAYVLRHRGLLVAGILTMMASAAVDLLLPEAIKRAVDGPISEGRMDGLGVYALAIVVLLVAGAIVRGAQTVLSVRTGRQIGTSLRTDVFDQVQRHSLRFFDRNPVGVLVTRVTGDIEAIESFFASGVAAAFHDGLKLALVLGLMLWVNAYLALALVVVLPLLVVCSLVFTNRSRRDFRRVRTETGSTNGYTAEAIGGLTVTRLFQREEAVDRAFGEHVDRLRDAHLGTVRNFAFFFPAVEVLESLAVALVVHFGSGALLDRSFTFGELFQFWLLIEIFFQPIRSLSENLNLFLQAGTAGERVFRVLDSAPEIVAPAEAGALPAIEGHIAFDHVVFGYNPDDPVLRDVSFEAPPGSTIAIVGPTGAGKSSVLSLISRFYDPQHGVVRVDGRDVREFDPRALRRHIALVLQDVFLFRGSVLENIRLFDGDVGRDRVEGAIAAMRAERLLEGLPGGLDAEVEERGANLSVGQRQLIAFARALVRDPTILVLDEATSAIDTETEHWIQQALATLRAGRTTIVVAHRLSTIRTADRILVMQRGRIVEEGTHAALLAKNGLYRTLYELQVRETG